MTTFLADVEDLENPQDRFRILRCADCGLGLTEPFATPETIAELYSGGDSSDYEFPVPGIVGRLRDRLATDRVRAIAREANLSPKRVLDFGTGAGRYAAAVRSAFPRATVMGTDFGTEPPAQSYFSLDAGLRYLPYDAVVSEGMTFDFILARHVLEHVHDPVAMVRVWLALLKPGGVLYVEVPNMASKVARLIGSRWPLWYVPKHLSHFARPTLRRTLEAAGGQPTLGTCNMPLMGNIVAILTGHSRFDARFSILGVLLHPVQVAIESAFRESTCLYALVRR